MDFIFIIIKGNSESYFSNKTFTIDIILPELLEGSEKFSCTPHIVLPITNIFHYFHFYYFFNLFFNWRKIAFQCCVGFCRRAMRISYNYTYITSVFSLPPLFPSYCPGSSQNTRLGSLCYTATSYQVSIIHMVVSVCQCYFLYLYYYSTFVTNSESILIYEIKSIVYSDFLSFNRLCFFYCRISSRAHYF